MDFTNIGMIGLGARAYERTDRPRGEFFHTQWF